jgi:hypothetical protein
MENCMIDPPDSYWDDELSGDEEIPDPVECFLCGTLCFQDICPECIRKEGLS